MAVLDHVGIRVTDLERSVAFYHDMFGFEEMGRMRFAQSGMDAVAMKVGPENLIFLLHHPEFVAFPPSVEGRPDHFCVVFDPGEFEDVMARLESAGVFDRLDCELMPRTGATGRSLSRYILDPDNHQIEVKTR